MVLIRIEYLRVQLGDEQQMDPGEVLKYPAGGWVDDGLALLVCALPASPRDLRNFSHYFINHRIN